MLALYKFDYYYQIFTTNHTRYATVIAAPLLQAIEFKLSINRYKTHETNNSFFILAADTFNRFTEHTFIDIKAENFIRNKIVFK